LNCLALAVMMNVFIYSFEPTEPPEHFISIHNFENSRYRATADWTPVSTIRQATRTLRHEIKGMLKNYYGYMPYWVDTAYYQYMAMNLLTHICYFSIDIDPSTGDLGSIPNISRFNKVLNDGHDWGVRIHMTFTLFGNSSVTAFLNNAAARANAIANIRAMVDNYGIEGANLDFEFVTGSVRDSFSLFVNDLAYQLWNHANGWKELYMATPAVPEWYPGYDIAYLAAHSDGLFIMAYDFHWSGSTVAGPVSPCVPSSFWGQYCAAKTIGSYKAYGASASKLILGLPYYGIDWPTTSQDMGSSTTGTGSAVVYYYAFQNANTYGRLWDSYSQTPWYRYHTSQWHQCWYDDSVSLAIKFTMTNDSLLQGAGCWALTYDRSYDHIYNAIRRAFWVEAPTRHFTVQVNIDSLNVRDGPGTSYNILTTAPIGSKFVAFDYINNWYKVYFPANSGPYYAWMSGGDGITNQFMKGTTRNAILKVVVSLLNVHEGPGSSYPIITHIAQGQVFVIDSINGDWARIFMPYIDGHINGWCYLPSAATIPNPEDYNTYNCTVSSVVYPSAVQELDTFTVTLRITNTGFGPFDTLVFLKGTGNSPFYRSGNWQDSSRAKVYGFPGLPNQTFYSYCLFRAPDVGASTTVSDTFRFERNNVLYGPEVIVSLTVNPVGIAEYIFAVVNEDLFIKSTVFADEMQLIMPAAVKSCDITVYDVTGRKIIGMHAKPGMTARIGKELKSGVYFISLKNADGILTRKVVKIR